VMTWDANKQHLEPIAGRPAARPRAVLHSGQSVGCGVWTNIPDPFLSQQRLAADYGPECFRRPNHCSTGRAGWQRLGPDEGRQPLSMIRAGRLGAVERATRLYPWSHPVLPLAVSRRSLADRGWPVGIDCGPSGPSLVSPPMSTARSGSRIARAFCLSTCPVHRSDGTGKRPRPG